MPPVSLRTMLSISSIIAIGFLGSVIVTPLYPLYEREFGFSPLVLTLIYAAYAIGNLLALVVFGRLSDQLGRKRVVVPALGIAAIAGLLFLLASGTWWLAAGRLVTGLAVGILSSTGTAWLAEEYGPEHRGTATVVSATANLTGIAIGPLLGGLLAQYGPLPLHLPLIVYLVLVVAVAVAIAGVPDARRPQVTRFRELSFRPRIGLPRDRVAAFAAPAITGLVIFALGGLYFALIPSIVLRDLGIPDVAVAGAVVFEFGAVAGLFVLLLRRIGPGRAMVAGLLLLLLAAGLVVLAQGLRSLPLLIAAAAVGGMTLALGYRGSLEVVNRIASDDQRGQLTASYLIACFTGNSIPVIGIGLLSTVTDSLVATTVFAGVLGVLALVAIVSFRVVGVRTDPEAPDASGARA